jgi:ferrous iron transport protein B
MNILLMGNPNVGKSAVFSRLTGVHVTVSNYPGTTVEFTQGSMKLGEDKVVVIDVPGTYSLEATSKAEEVAVNMLHQGDLVMDVIDATNLERNLCLTLELRERGVPVIVALNMWDETKHRGIEIDVNRLEELLRVPVVPIVAITGQGMNELVKRIPEAASPEVPKRNPEERWQDVGKIVNQVQELTHRDHTLLESLRDLTVKPVTGLPIAAALICLVFFLIRLIGEGLIGRVFEPLFEEGWKPIVMKLSGILGGSGFLHDILVGKLIEREVDFRQSFGILTTGLFVPIAMVLPYVFSFYLILSLLEDCGYLSRFAVLVDKLMHNVGLHGFASISMILGMGCNIPGALATRVLETRRERFIAATLMAIAVPCMAQIGMIIGLVGERGTGYLVWVFGTLLVVWIVIGLLLNLILKGESMELLLEVPPYRIPYWQSLLKKLWMRTRQFILSAVPLVLLGVLVVNILYALGVIRILSRITAPVMTRILGLPEEAISALLIGFLRKDVAVGMLGPLNLTAGQLVVACVVLAMYFPCVGTFAILIRELGPKDMLKGTAIMVVSAVAVGGVLNLIL